MKTINLHEYQIKAVQSTNKVVACVSGIQGGKTFVGSLALRVAVGRYLDKKDCFLVCAPDYKIMSQATLPAFLTVMKGMGELKKQEMIYKFHDGRIAYLRSMVDPDSIEGITNCRYVWGDEAGKMSMKAWINMQGRAAFKEAQIFLSTTPYSLNWLYRDVYIPWRDGNRTDVDIFQWRSIDNPYFPQAEYDRQRALLDERVFDMKYNGTFARMAGLVYRDFDEFHNITDPVELDRDKLFICAGVDFGYQDPFAIVVRAIGYKHPVDYQVDEFFETHHTPDECVRIARQFKEKYNIQVFYCDSERPDYIAAFNKAGLNAAPVKKGKGSVMAGIGLHNALLRTKEHAVFRGRCPHTLDEYETYHFPEITGDEVNQKEVPVDANNHLMDATRYATMGTQWLRDKRERETAFVPAKTHMERLLAGEFAHHEPDEDWYNR